MRVSKNILTRPAAAKSLQSCPTLCDPIDGSPPGSPVPGILQARILEWVAISFSNAWKWKVKVKSLSRVRLLATPWTAAYQASPSIGFSRQEYWSGVPYSCTLMNWVCKKQWSLLCRYLTPYFQTQSFWPFSLKGQLCSHQRTDAFEMQCWRRLLRVLWTARRSN